MYALEVWCWWCVGGALVVVVPVLIVMASTVEVVLIAAALVVVVVVVMPWGGLSVPAVVFTMCVRSDLWAGSSVHGVTAACLRYCVPGGG